MLVAAAAVAAGASPPPLVLALAGPDLDKAALSILGATSVTIVEGGFDAALVADMVDDGRTIWDVCTTDFATGVTLARAGLLEALDAAVLARTPGPLTPAGPAPWWGAPAAVAHLVLARDTNAAGAPRNWAEFYQGGDLPEHRAMPADLVMGVLETALLADGVAPGALYPLDVERAFARLTMARPRMVFWRNGAQARALMENGVAAGLLCSHAVRQSAGRFERSPAPGIGLRFLWVVPKGNPAGAAAAMRFIAATQTPDRLGDSAKPDNEVWADEAWYGENSAWLLARWHDLVRG